MQGFPFSKSQLLLLHCDHLLDLSTYYSTYESFSSIVRITRSPPSDLATQQDYDAESK